MSRPKHLELYGCEGGSARGYADAGSDVYVVDLFKHRNSKGKWVGFSQGRCPFPSHQGDVLDVLRRLLAGEKIPFIHRKAGAARWQPGEVEWLGLEDFATAGASPPCQKDSAGTRGIDRSGYPDLIGPTRELLVQTGLPYVIENVEGARHKLIDPILLCGTMFCLHAIDDDGTKLEMWRHRLFESNVPLVPPGPCQHGWFSQQVAGSYGGARRDKDEARNERHGGYVPAIHVQQKLLGIDWMTQGGMHQSIPPVYTEHLGIQLLEAIRR